ncbi:MAG: hypothetical protein ACETWM_20235 [Candidatus Lokiarchaeia archaeon]
MDSYRPGGVTAIAILFMIIAGLGIIAGILGEIYYVTDYTNSIYSDLSFGISLLYIPSFSSESGIYFVYLVVINAINDLSSVIYLHLVVLGILIVSGLHLFASVGLLRMKKWGYYLALIIGILYIFSLGIIGIIMGILILVYLLRDVKYEFE